MSETNTRLARQRQRMAALAPEVAERSGKGYAGVPPPKRHGEKG